MTQPEDVPVSKDRAASLAAERAAAAVQRIAELQNRRKRLEDGEPATDVDLEEADRAARIAQLRCEEAHHRAAEAHRRAAGVHLGAVEKLDASSMAGAHDRAKTHRRAAEAEAMAADVEAAKERD